MELWLKKRKQHLRKWTLEVVYMMEQETQCEIGVSGEKLGSIDKKTKQKSPAAHGLLKFF